MFFWVCYIYINLLTIKNWIKVVPRLVRNIKALFRYFTIYCWTFVANPVTLFCVHKDIKSWNLCNTNYFDLGALVAIAAHISKYHMLFSCFVVRWYVHSKISILHRVTNVITNYISQDCTVSVPTSQQHWYGVE